MQQAVGRILVSTMIVVCVTVVLVVVVVCGGVKGLLLYCSIRPRS